MQVEKFLKSKDIYEEILRMKDIIVELKEVNKVEREKDVRLKIINPYGSDIYIEDAERKASVISILIDDYTYLLKELKLKFKKI